MKKYLTFPNISIAVILCIALVTLVTGNFKISIINPQKPRDFVENTLPKIAKDWDTEYLTSVSLFKEDDINHNLLQMKERMGSCSIKNLKWVQTNMFTRMSYVYLFQLECENGNYEGSVMIALQNGLYKYIAIDTKEN